MPPITMLNGLTLSFPWRENLKYCIGEQAHVLSSNSFTVYIRTDSIVHACNYVINPVSVSQLFVRWFLAPKIMVCNLIVLVLYVCCTSRF